MARGERKPDIPEEGEILIRHKIRALRWGYGKSIPELRELLGGAYSRSHLSHVETGSEKPSEELIDQTLRVLGITREEFDSFSRDQLKEFVKNGSPSFQKRFNGDVADSSPLKQMQTPMQILTEIRDELKSIAVAQAILAEQVGILVAGQEVRLDTEQNLSIPTADILVF